MTTENGTVICDRWNFAVAFTDEDGNQNIQEDSCLLPSDPVLGATETLDDYFESGLYDSVTTALEKHWDYSRGSLPEVEVRVISHESAAAVLPDIQQVIETNGGRTISHVDWQKD